MLTDRLEAPLARSPPWLEAFETVLRLCGAVPGMPLCLLAESQSRALNLDLAKLAVLRLGCRPFRCIVPSPASTAPVPVRSTGASRALAGHPAALAALAASPLILNPTAGVWGCTDRPGTVAHWPGGVAVSCPPAGSVNGRLVLAAGDVNLTFKRYLESPVRLALVDDYATEIAGTGTGTGMGTDAALSGGLGDPVAYAVSHVGWGMNPRARYKALEVYGKRDTNGTELGAFAGDFLFSAGANEFAGRFTEGHLDIPVRGCTSTLDGKAVVVEGRLA